VGKNSNLRNWAILFRLGNNISGIVGVFLGSVMALGFMPNGYLFYITSLLALSVFFFMGSWNALNDSLDFEIDKLNKPDRPLPSGGISVKDAKLAIISMMLLSLVSLIFAALIANKTENGLIDWSPSVIIWIVAVFLLINYESSSKYSLNLKNRGLPGNLAISAAVAMVVLLGAAGVYHPTNVRVISVAIIGFLFNLSREIIKDVQDMEGDEGRNTLAMKIGAERTRIFAYLISLLSLISIILPFALNIFEDYYLVLTTPGIFLLLRVKTKLANGQDFQAQQLLKKSLYLCVGAFFICSLI
jgi:geranylgeranylglycerol-phosphate geranylgeranyltransferase